MGSIFKCKPCWKDIRTIIAPFNPLHLALFFHFFCFNLSLCLYLCLYSVTPAILFSYAFFPYSVAFILFLSFFILKFITVNQDNRIQPRGPCHILSHIHSRHLALRPNKAPQPLWSTSYVCLAVIYKSPQMLLLAHLSRSLTLFWASRGEGILNWTFFINFSRLIIPP